MLDDHEINYRRICWPSFDDVCLRGGCLACNDHAYRHLTGIRNAARTRGMIDDYNSGYANGFHNADTRKTRP